MIIDISNPKEVIIKEGDVVIGMIESMVLKVSIEDGKVISDVQIKQCKTNQTQKITSITGESVVMEGRNVL